MATLPVISTLAVDPQNTTERQATYTPAGAGQTLDRPPVVYAHGAGGIATQAFDNPAVNALAAQGFPVIARGLGGDQWGSDLGIARVEQSRAWAISSLGARATAKALFFGYSMGALNVLNYARLNLDKVGAIVLVCPVLSLADFHDNNRGGYAASIETAYGGASGYAAAASARSPALFAGQLAGIPIRVYYSANDALCLPGFVAPFVADVGSAASAVSMGNVGHASAQAAVPTDDAIAFALSAYP